ncbi:hypothetical protein M8J77_000120 [Diaphorina citri]|nr:hypothetical protein M8J77_000120 [Diaphorina citri]
MDKLSLYFITWNVATRPPGENVRTLLDLGRFPPNELPDFYFIGLQEVKSQPQNFVLDSLIDDPWTKAFKTALSPHDYVKVRTVRLVGILLNVFCLRKHLNYLRNMESAITRTGLMGLWGNKGAISLRLEIYGVNLCVVNAHFAAHDHQNKQRINDYNTVIREQSFTVDKESTRILYHDYIFWIGDLNFRLNNPETYTQDIITDRIRDGQFNDLLEQDQLRAVMQSGEAFSEFNETTPTFQPTFKYQFNSHNYDNKRRCAWTDRILYKVNENNYEDVKLSLEQLKYTSLQDYGTSDHKPVLAEFKIKICPTIFSSGCLPPVDSERVRRDAVPHRVSLASVAFDPIVRWTLDDRNNITVYFGGGYQPNPWDWIGVFPENFSSLDDYICYIYIPLPFSSTDLSFPLSLDEEGIDIAHQTPCTSTNSGLFPRKSSHSLLRQNTDVFSQSKEGENNATSDDSELTRSQSSEPEDVDNDISRTRSKKPESDAPSSPNSRRSKTNKRKVSVNINFSQRSENSESDENSDDSDLSRDKPNGTEVSVQNNISPRSGKSEPGAQQIRNPDLSRIQSGKPVEASPLESIVIPFPDSAIRRPGFYRLVYFTNRTTDVLGISNAFKAVDSGSSLDRSYNLDW